MKMNRIDLTGQRFGRLVAIRDVGAHRNRARLWELRCDCGNSKVGNTRLLGEGKLLSCGCMLVEKKAAGKTVRVQHKKRCPTCGEAFFFMSRASVPSYCPKCSGNYRRVWRRDRIKVERARERRWRKQDYVRRPEQYSSQAAAYYNRCAERIRNRVAQYACSARGVALRAAWWQTPNGRKARVMANYGIRRRQVDLIPAILDLYQLVYQRRKENDNGRRNS